MAADSLLPLLVNANLAGSAAIAGVLALRGPVRRLAGSRAAYALWLVPPLAALASLLPARTVTIEAAPLPVGLTAVDLSGVVAQASFDWRAAVLMLWIAGAVLAALRLAIIHRRAVRGLGRMTQDGPGVMRAETTDVGPAALGVFRPRIILPADFEHRFDERERRVVLAHERAHLADGHVVAKAAAQLLVCLNWFNPLVHVAVGRLAVDQELACDEAVILSHPGDRKAYATALLKTQTGPALPLGCCWPSRSARLLKARVTLVSGTAKTTRRRVIGVAAAGLIAVGAGVAAWAAQPARIVTISTDSPRASQVAPLTPRGESFSSVSPARQLLADAVPTKTQGETKMLTQKTGSTRLASAAVVAAIGLGAGHAMAADPAPQVSVSNSQPAPNASAAVQALPANMSAPMLKMQSGADGGSDAVVLMSGRRVAGVRSPEEVARAKALNAALGLPEDARVNLGCMTTNPAVAPTCQVGVNGGPMSPLSDEATAKLRALGVVPMAGGGVARLVSRSASAGE